MTSNIYDLANALERGIRNLSEYESVVKAKEAIEADGEAQLIWKDFLASQTKLQNLMQSGQMPSEEDQKEMENISKAIEGNAYLRTYFAAQQSLAVYVQDIERIVFAPLNDLAK